MSCYSVLLHSEMDMKIPFLSQIDRVGKSYCIQYLCIQQLFVYLHFIIVYLFVFYVLSAEKLLDAEGLT